MYCIREHKILHFNVGEANVKIHVSESCLWIFRISSAAHCKSEVMTIIFAVEIGRFPDTTIRFVEVDSSIDSVDHTRQTLSL